MNIGNITCRGDFPEDGLPVGHLEGSQMSFNAVFSSDSVVNDLDVKLSHPTQDGLKSKHFFFFFLLLTM